MGRRNEHSREELRELALRAAGELVAEGDGKGGIAALVHARSRAAHRLHRGRAVHRVPESRRPHRAAQPADRHRAARRPRTHSWARQPAGAEPAAAGGRVPRVLRCSTRRAGAWCSNTDCRKGRRRRRPTRAIPRPSSRWSGDPLARGRRGARRRCGPPSWRTALWSGAHGICMLAVTGKLQVGDPSIGAAFARRAARSLSR